MESQTGHQVPVSQQPNRAKTMLRILYFARLRDELDCGEEQIEYQPDWMTIADLKHTLSERDPRWQKAFSGTILHSVNHAIAPADQVISDGDEIAFFPPVTGG